MATKNLIGNPYGIIDQEVNKDVAKSGFSDGISASHLFTHNEGEIKIIYDEMLEPNSEIRIGNQYVTWQSPLVTRNLTNQRVRTHYFAQSMKNMWSDWRSYQFHGRYNDFPTPELHFASSVLKRVELSTTPSTLVTDKFLFNFRSRTRVSGGSYGSFSSRNSDVSSYQLSLLTAACYNAFCTYFAKGSLGEHLGFQSDTLFTEKNTPNPWPFMCYLNFYKWFISNKYVLRGNDRFKKVWFPDDEDDFKFKTGTANKTTGKIGRFFSPEFRSGIDITKLGVQMDFSFTADGNGHLKSCDSVYITTIFDYVDHSDGSVLAEPQTVIFDSSTDVSKKIASLIDGKVKFALIPFDSYNFWTKLNFDDFTAETWVYILNEFKEAAIANIPLTSDSKTAVLDLFETRYMNFNKDYFTGGLISPLINTDYPQISSSTSVTGITAETTLSGGSVSSEINFQNSFAADSLDSEDFQENAPIHVIQDSDGVNFLAGIESGYTSQRARAISALNNAVITNSLNLPTAETTITGSGVVSNGFGIPDLRLLSATSDYLEALARSDGDYRNMVLAIYGVKPSETSEAPIFIGGSSSYIQTEDIFQTAPTDNSPLGNVTQTGFSGGNNYIGSLFVKDTTCVLGVMSVVPEVYYCQGVPKKWTMRSYLEHQNPKFNGVSMQAIENREIFVSGNDSKDFEPFSYAPAWEFMRHRQNRLSGLCKPHFDSDGLLIDKPFTQMVQSRIFDSTPDFNDDFVSTKNNISTEHLVMQDITVTPEFVTDVMHNITEILPITRSGLPQKI